MRPVDGMARSEWVVVPQSPGLTRPPDAYGRGFLFLPEFLQHFCKESPMPKAMHQKAAEHHEQTAKAHRTAAEQHGSNDHVSAKQQSAQAAEKSKTAHEHSTQANSKSQQQK